MSDLDAALDALVGQIIDVNGQAVLITRRVGNLVQVRTEAGCVSDPDDRVVEVADGIPDCPGGSLGGS